MLGGLLAATFLTALTLGSGELVGSLGGRTAPMPSTSPVAADQGWDPPDTTVVRVTGTARSGFRVERYDAPTDYLPTRSEAFAECGEYHARLDRVRCRVKMRTRYGDLGAMKRALRLARDQPS